MVWFGVLCSITCHCRRPGRQSRRWTLAGAPAAPAMPVLQRQPGAAPQGAAYTRSMTWQAAAGRGRFGGPLSAGEVSCRRARGGRELPARGQGRQTGWGRGQRMGQIPRAEGQRQGLRVGRCRSRDINDVAAQCAGGAWGAAWAPAACAPPASQPALALALAARRPALRGWPPRPTARPRAIMARPRAHGGL